jgi:putative pyruvate formate lyase activating enzyme
MQGSTLRLAWAGLHHGEEPVISGQEGSGTVFFSGCSLQCAFCQNRQISHGNIGSNVSIEKLFRIIMALWEAGAESINLVTGTPHIPPIIAALELAKDRGMSLPIVWNTSGYESLSSLDILSEHVDIYLTDLKTLDRSLSDRLFNAPDYPRVVREALPKMLEGRKLQIRDCTMQRGVIVRHLVLPGQLESTYRCLEWFQKEIGSEALLSLMFQYLPTPRHSAIEHTGERHSAKRLTSNPDETPILPDRRINRSEEEIVMRWLDELGIVEGFVQELPGDGSWLPDFTKENPFPPEQAQALLHW